MEKSSYQKHRKIFGLTGENSFGIQSEKNNEINLIGIKYSKCFPNIIKQKIQFCPLLYPQSRENWVSQAKC